MRLRHFRLVAGFLALPLAGCARVESASDRHMAAMSEAIGQDQAEQDRANRLDLSEVPPAEERAKSRTTVPVVAPRQRTVQIGESEDGSDTDDPNDPAQRPEIRLQGSGGGSRSTVRSKMSRHDDDPSRPSILDPDAKSAYDAALALVHAHQYDRALDALAAFLVKWPDHPYAENALYWRGESFFARGEYLRAAEQFEAVLARFGGGKKAPDSLLKIGLCHERLGSPDRAKEYWDRLRREQPRSEAAKKIPSTEPSANKEGRENR